MEQSNSITVNVYDLRKGLIVYNEVSYVRIISKDYNLLVMLDYMPIIGEIDGRVDIKAGDQEYTFDNIKASYMCADNVFNLMILLNKPVEKKDTPEIEGDNNDK